MILLNNNKVEFGQFPNNELNLSKLDIVNSEKAGINKIYWYYENDCEFFQLYILKSQLDKEYIKCGLFIDYMPYSRMDRENDSYVFTLKYVCNFINDLNFVGVTVVEPHSDVTPALLNNCIIKHWCMDNLDHFKQNKCFDSLFFPDAGAEKRYTTDMPYGVGLKQRDFKTGAITNFYIIGDVGKNVLIVDDLCSRGGTFIKSAIELKKKGAKNVSLMVAHCENIVFTGELFEHIDFLYTRQGVLNRKHK